MRAKFEAFYMKLLILLPSYPSTFVILKLFTKYLLTISPSLKTVMIIDFHKIIKSKIKHKIFLLQNKNKCCTKISYKPLLLSYHLSNSYSF